MGEWQTGWMRAIADVSAFETSVEDVTLRMSVVSGLSGESVRLELSNRFGATSLMVGSCVLAAGGRSAEALFDGRPEVEIAPGESRWTDPASLTVERDGDVRIDLYLPETTMHSTGNYSRTSVGVSAPGNFAGLDDFGTTELPMLPAPDGSELPSPVPFLRRLEVQAAPPEMVVACLGDSITAGGWPEVAAAALEGEVDLVMLNLGIAGNRLRVDPAPEIASFGLSGVSRFSEDVCATSGVTDVVIALGTNDIGLPGAAAPASDLPAADQIIDAYRRLIVEAQNANINVTIATITPFIGAEGIDSNRDAIRNGVNDWIRTSAPNFVDFDQAVRSEAHPDRLAEEFDSGDHLHPNETGTQRLGRAMANEIARRRGLELG
ncbi:hypothetical protein JYJ95_11690 [Corallococcus exiguus]|uniref:GDSL-type esterase/lipase family protein n=1 Tax=Corallococcus exiguus TaxID=83462 RepID=UPI001A9019D3|nr:GDSL-type esterase/lipase family protein [Corallococcus exiguus]MBN8467182.1 hypothetical protein [Corallococcus exiguus]